MKHWKRGIVASALVMGMTIPGVVQAAAPATLPFTEDSVKPSHRDHGDHAKKFHGMHSGAHQKMYMTLLAEKYTPNSVGEWQAAFKERERLMNELEAARSANSDDPKEKKMDEQGKNDDNDARRARMEQYKQTREEFNAAIESGDAAKIKETLPKMLEQLKSKNERLAQKLKEKKK
ncbi:hypothetical protein [uncultured Brevibacillus sp.]|uniref:hypothetical protein n=1 Tax=uncultured Brevibacillus sp. TaxID=169970 RepID=UPI002595A613|nr:hypothetical protein [uncultured Brevibacillus sp.]